ncbi:complement receptor type 2 isoform X3 [Erinaceus europaeus]|uniref:Complement receptor type 2 isoform X3 n=1 Tax=Erinaceus europaeus TaxID=9365 RepID=A0ABM3WCL0_ERIEU|nr:complement receptor type 2 isoform X3 [Erinaceus europaeus]
MGAAALQWLCWALLAPGVLGQCKLLPSYTFARPKARSDQAEFAVGTSWEYECLPGYKKRSFSVTCLPTSQWSDAQQFCKRRSCEHPRDLLHGTILYPQGIEWGSTITFSCNRGYRLIGDASAMCVLTDRGMSWDVHMPLCDTILCGLPPAIPHGDFSDQNKDSLPYGAVVTYRCHTGQRGEKLFDLVGEPSIHCTSRDGREGVWSGPPPLCLPAVKCPAPYVENGVLEAGFRRSFSLNDSVAFKCQPGFTMRGASVVWCHLGGTWRPPLPSCIQGCPPPPQVPHGSHGHEAQDVFPTGQRVSYHCEPGHTLRGSDTLDCTSSGTWHPPAPTCEAQSCEALPSLLHGRVLVPPSLQLGAQVAFVCDEGFRLSGQPSSRCVSEGTRMVWNTELPVCDPLSCGPPPPITHGRNTYSGSATVNTVVKYSCPSAFRLIGDSVLFCRGGGQADAYWDKAAPVCEVFNRYVQCPEPHVPGGQKDRRARPPFWHGAAVTFSCQANFTMRGNRTLWCQANGSWGPTALPVCESDTPLDCPPLPASPHAQHSGPVGVRSRPGQAVLFSCEPGYLLQGEKTLRCLSSGAWSSEPPTCTEAQCDPPVPPRHGQVQQPPSLQLGSTATFSCTEGYRLKGQASSRCVIAGQKATWTRIPECEEIRCPPPPPAIQGTHSGNTSWPATYGSSVTYHCLPGPEPGVDFILVGESTLRCTADAQLEGVWSGPAPHCQLAVSGGPCPPPQVPGGRVVSGQKQHYSYNDTLGLTCEPGFTLKGSTRTRCSGRGSWEPELPRCEKACPAPPRILNGQLEDRGTLHFDPGTSVRYRCSLGYTLEGADTLRCSSQGVWMPSAPQCTAAPCEPVLKQTFKRPQHGFIRTEANSSCEEGYYLGSSVYQLCGGAQLWYQEVRLCKEITCTPPPAITDGVHSGSPSQEAPYGTRVTYSCRPGPERGVDFQLVGDSALSCTSRDGRTGTWSGPAPTCRLLLPSTRCPAPHVPNGFRVSGRDGPHSYNDSVTFQCVDGFTLRGSGWARCTANGTWEPVVPACEKGCPPPPGPQHGQHTGGSRALFEPGVTVDFSCDPGYRLVGSPSSRCAPSGSWSPSAPRCEEAPCQPVEDAGPEPPAGSHVVPFNTSCAEGYQLLGYVHRRCQDLESGVWFQKIPHCEAIHCPPPPSIAHGRVLNAPTQPAPYSREISYRCDPGFSLQGERSLRCVQDSQGHGAWSGQAPRCEAIPRETLCPRPEVRHGHVLNQSQPTFVPGTLLRVACTPGFLLNGSQWVRCHRDGRWVPVPPTCIKKASSGCRPLKIAHGNHTGGDITRFPPGMSVLYSCDPGHLLVGEPLLLCTHEGAWSQPAPHCTEVNCSSPESVLGVQRGLEPGRLYQYGTIVTLECEDGYTLEGSSQSQCQDDHRWSPPLAVCKSHGSLAPLVSGLSAGFLFLLCLASAAWCMLLRHRGRNYYTNRAPRGGGDIHLETREVYSVDPYNPAS